jgi:inhibitor of KinA
MQTFLYGENAIVLQISYEDTSTAVHEIQSLYRKVQQVGREMGIVSLRPGLDCLVVEYDARFDIDRFVEKFSTNEKKVRTDSPTDPTMVLPVCYEEECATDILEVVRLTGMSQQDIIELHSTSTYDVWLVGFMPGFPYLGSLNERLRIPRKIRPDLSIPAGSVAIAEEFTGIYPADSPGGWHVIGRTPKKLVDFTKTPPWLFDYGMKIQIQPITLEQFHQFNE